MTLRSRGEKVIDALFDWGEGVVDTVLDWGDVVLERVPKWARDPLVSLANTPLALLCTLVVSWLLAGVLFSVLEVDASVGSGLYWSITTLSTTGYGDLSPHTGAGRVLAGLYMAWALFFLLPAAIFHIGERILSGRNTFTHEEQVELLDKVRSQEQALAKIQRTLDSW